MSVTLRIVLAPVVAAACVAATLVAQAPPPAPPPPAPPANAMTNPYRMLDALAAPRRDQSRRGDRHRARQQGRRVAAAPLRAGHPALRRLRQYRQAVRGDVRLVTRAVPGRRRESVGGGQRAVHRYARRHRRQGQSGLQVRSERQAAADAWQGRRVSRRQRHLPATDRLPRDAGRQHRHRRWTLAASEGQPAGRRSPGLVHARRKIHQGVRPPRHASRANSSARTASPSIRRAACSSPTDRTTASRFSTAT